MSHLGWINWNRLHARYKAGLLPHGLEREALKYLHRKSSLNLLARRIASACPGLAVRAESIWIDGTPQATFTDMSGQTANCELADLLLIVRKELPTGQLIDENALLLQAKVTPKYNRLTSGSSTKLERRLLENVNRTLQIDLHRDTQRKNLINTYVLGPGAYGAIGLKDCARYLLVPKGAAWANAGFSFPPYQVGWPRSMPGPFLTKPIGFVDAALGIGVRGTLGRPVTASPTDVWSKMISDLRGAYVGVVMPGYGHGRIHVGTAFMSVSGLAWLSSTPSFGRPRPVLMSRRDLPPLDIEHLADRPPAIPIVFVILTGDEDSFGVLKTSVPRLEEG